ncbi:MAG TPA: iron-containing redox enzyme family protein [Blastocatellia bacterium]|nr:iron-containing redox enzyme family protein [Blastocatellia bacterium]
MDNTIEQSLREITKHPALDNAFYSDWMSRCLNLNELQVFARNYGAWVRSFPDALATLVVTTSDLEAKGEYVKTLYSEMGYGNSSKAHSVLLDAFFSALAEKLGDRSRLDWGRLERDVELAPSTRDLLAGELELYRDAQMSVGAQLALEWQAYTMLRQLYDGARNYLHLWDQPDEFHEACEYFYAHIGAAEKDHKDQSLRALVQSAREGTIGKTMQGYNRHLDLIFNFWNGLHKAVVSKAARTSPATATP